MSVILSEATGLLRPASGTTARRDVDDAARGMSSAPRCGIGPPGEDASLALSMTVAGDGACICGLDLNSPTIAGPAP